MSDLDNIYPLGGLFGSTPSEPEFPDYYKCAPRPSEAELGNGYVIVCYNDEFMKVPFQDFSFKFILERLPVGSVIDWVGDETPPLGWAVLDGSSFDPVTYPELAGLLGSNVLPNFSGRVTGYKGNAPFDGSIGDTLGSTNKTLDVDNLPPHTHNYIDQARFNEGENDGGGGVISTSPTVTAFELNTDFTGENGLMENVQPCVIINKIIKAVPVGDQTTFFPPSDTNVFAETGIEFVSFCARSNDPLSSIEIPLDPYIPTHDLNLCPMNIELGVSTTGGGLSSFALTRVGDKYTGSAGTIGGTMGIPLTPVFIDINEVDNNSWNIVYNVDNSNFDTITSSTDFPSCPTSATWVSPVLFEGELLTVDYLSATP